MTDIAGIVVVGNDRGQGKSALCIKEISGSLSSG